MVATESETELEIGDEAPTFELPGVDGRFDLAETTAPAVLVVFTCNHCPYAQAKFELLNDLAADYDDCLVVGINPNDAEEYPDDSFEAMEAYVADGEVAYDAYLRDERQDVARAYGAVCTPDPFLLRRDGDGYRVAYHARLDDALNPDDETSEVYVRDAIDRVLAGEPVEMDPGPSRGCSIKWQA
jgi:peroxiredoxin